MDERYERESRAIIADVEKSVELMMDIVKFALGLFFFLVTFPFWGPIFIIRRVMWLWRESRGGSDEKR